ncbi:MAG: hypothetical protein LBV47_00700 [Bacteroidales bacterium]|jgi:hypothetical protein|nr:hypothetical protein [Bacteroidales bacterium]
MQEVQFRKKRESGEIITDSFLFLKQEIKPLSKLFALYVLPFVLVYAVFQIYMQKEIMSRIDLNNPEMILANIKPVSMHFLICCLFELFVNSLFIGVFYTYIDLYVKKGKGNFEMHEITGALFSNSLKAFGAVLLLFSITVFGLTLCILPGIYFANTLSFAIFIAIFEKKGTGNAFSRSFYLVNKQWLNTLLVNVLGLSILFGISLFLSIPTIMFDTFSGIRQNGIVEYPQWYWFIMSVSIVCSIVLSVIIYTFIAFQYFNIEERTKPVQPQAQNLLGE